MLVSILDDKLHRILKCVISRGKGDCPGREDRRRRHAPPDGPSPLIFGFRA